MPDPTELTNEELGWLIRGTTAGASPEQLKLLHKLGLFRRALFGKTALTPRGRELVDIAVRAVNAKLRSSRP